MKCNIRCWMAKSTDCTCACNGENHGKDQVAIMTNSVVKNTRLKINRLKKIHIFEGKAETREVWIDGQYLSPDYSQKCFNHSPDGFNWGYMGSGPSQLALAIMLEFLSEHEALALYMQFKGEFVAKLPQGQDFKVQFNILNWIAANRVREIV